MNIDSLPHFSNVHVLTPEVVDENDLYIKSVLYPPREKGESTQAHLILARVRVRHEDRFEYECLDETKHFTLGTHFYGKSEGAILKKGPLGTTLYVDTPSLITS